jgi:hypothetical protein
MADQYVVVFMPGATLNVEAVGPFRSLARAEQVAERVDIYTYNLDGDAVNSAVQIVRLISEREAVDIVTGATHG